MLMHPVAAAGLFRLRSARIVAASVTKAGRRAKTSDTSESSTMVAPKTVATPHSDMEVPDFSSYRLASVKDPTSRAEDSVPERQGFTYLMTGVLGATSLYGAKNTVNGFLASMLPAADMLAGGVVEIKLEKIEEGKNVTFEWRKKPLFVRHRTAEEIKTEQNVDISTLRDPQTDEERVKDPKWLVVIGVCTHLGCVPIANKGEWGGYYCPCHGSHYDASGRIRKGPAPLNLEVPFYEFPEEGLLSVGEV